ncbi:MAG: hypothetical protein R3D55_23345 [Chloroflexota bacterium]
MGNFPASGSAQVDLVTAVSTNCRASAESWVNPGSTSYKNVRSPATLSNVKLRQRIVKIIADHNQPGIAPGTRSWADF